MAGSWSGSSGEGLDELFVLVNGFVPDDFSDPVSASFWASWQLLAIPSSHAPYLIFPKMELDSMGKLMPEDGFDTPRVAIKEFGGNDNLDFPLSGVVVSITTVGHVPGFGELRGLSNDKRRVEVRPNDGLDIAVQVSV